MAVLPPGVHEQFPDDREQLTPLFRQYLEIKDAQPQGILFYRLGDFYEMFGPDAVRAAEILGLTLTSRSCFKDYKVAMCGVPHHSSAKYIRQLVRAGEVISVCEQAEDPSEAKGLVKREVARVITAGTLVEDEFLEGEGANFLAVFAESPGRVGAALLESSSGRVDLYEAAADDAGRLFGTVLNQQPAEVLLPEERQQLHKDGDYSAAGVRHTYAKLPGGSDIRFFLLRYFKLETLAALGIEQAAAAQAALFALIRYLKESYRAGEVALYPRFQPLDGLLQVSARTAAHLELAQPASSTGHSLYSLVCRCETAGGRRLLRRWLLAPLADARQITQRHNAVGNLAGDPDLLNSLAALLQQVPDVERIANRAGLRKTNPKEISALAAALAPLTEAGRLALQLGGELFGGPDTLVGNLNPLAAEIDRVLAEDPPVRPSDGGVVRPGADREVDELRDLLSGGKRWIADFEEQQRDLTGIRTLKVKRTDAFGYFIEVSKANLALVPDIYTRRQTLVNSERFVTPELAERETKLSQASALLAQREALLFEELLTVVDNWQQRLVRAAGTASAIDCLLSFARMAQEGHWVQAELDTSDAPQVAIEGGRHPLVEAAVGSRHYTPNHCYLDHGNQQIAMITGPNMGGKSTYLRMVALLAILNQAGSFVPAAKARLPVFNRIFSRIGAQDRLGEGQSTFMVEMVETAEILRNCGSASLLLLDEVGRGTSTYDGISIAKAVIEHLHEHPDRPLTLFATHFFELTDLAQVLGRVVNLQVEVAREQDRFVFLYKVTPGAASDSFGIDVAALAGLPDSVVDRARQVLSELEDVRAQALQGARRIVQTGLFEPE